jgi:hypothetical protein
MGQQLFKMDYSTVSQAAKRFEQKSKVNHKIGEIKQKIIEAYHIKRIKCQMWRTQNSKIYLTLFIIENCKSIVIKLILFYKKEDFYLFYRIKIKRIWIEY